MNNLYKSYLFSKHILVCEDTTPSSTYEKVGALFTLAKNFRIIISKGDFFASKSIVEFVDNERGGYNLPEAFYRNFPMSVKRLTTDKLLMDQLAHYADTYGIDEFDGQGGQSKCEEEIIRVTFNESLPFEEFVIYTEEQAEKVLNDIISNLLTGTRPLNDTQWKIVFTFYNSNRDRYDLWNNNIPCKDTAIKLFAATNDKIFLNSLKLSDTLKIVEAIVLERTECPATMNKLHLCNSDRKIIVDVIDTFLDKVSSLETFSKLLTDCFEKKKLWCGLLHHIHYMPTGKSNAEMKTLFCDYMRGKVNNSVPSLIDKYLNNNDPIGAATITVKTKGPTYLLRNLSYILSRCSSQQQVWEVIKQLNNVTPTALMQATLNYTQQYDGKPRNFVFTKNNKIKKHIETPEECESRMSALSPETNKFVYATLRDKFNNIYKGMFDSVYIDPSMKNVALPIYESASDVGYGTMTTGSRFPLNDGKIRAFVYWKKVNDIDLSVIAIGNNGEQGEFSWRTMYRNQSDMIAFSGDQTNGYNGGSEYFDVDTKLVRERYPDIKYMLFCANVYSGVDFNTVECKAGYMSRKDLEAGEIFEPSTVRSAFKVNPKSTFAIMFAVDVKTNEVIWINKGINGRSIVAGNTNLGWINKYMDIVKTFNYYDFFNNAATTKVSKPEDASLIISDNVSGENVIHSYDFEKVTAYINRNTLGGK